eukprot:gene5283-8066_t
MYTPGKFDSIVDTPAHGRAAPSPMYFTPHTFASPANLQAGFGHPPNSAQRSTDNSREDDDLMGEGTSDESDGGDVLYGGSTDRRYAEQLEQQEVTGRIILVDGEKELLREYIKPLESSLEMAHEEAGMPAYSKRERESVALKNKLLEEELNTWQLIEVLLVDALRTDAQAYPTRDVPSCIAAAIPAHRWWAISHRQLLSLRISADHNLRRSLLALVWLERVYASSSARQHRLEHHVADGYRKHTAKLLEAGLGGQACPTTNRPLVSSLDLDAPRRERAHVHPADEESERTLYGVVLDHLRCGQVEAARELCEAKGHTLTAGLLTESFELLQHLPGVHPSVAPAGVELPEAILSRLHLRDDSCQPNTHHFTYAAALLDLATDENTQDCAPGGSWHAAVFGALAGRTPSMLMGLGPAAGFRDRLWAYLRGYAEHVVHATVQPYLAGHPDYHEEDAMRVLEDTRPAHAGLSQLSYHAMAAASGPDPSGLAQLQSLLLRLFGGDVHAGRAVFLETFRFLSAKASKTAPRLAAHVAMQLWRCRIHILGDHLDGPDADVAGGCLDAVLSEYARQLFRENEGDPMLLLAVVPYLASKMVSSGVRLAAELAVVLTAPRAPAEADALVQRLIGRLDQVSVDPERVLLAAAELYSADPGAVSRVWHDSRDTRQPAEGDAVAGQVQAIRFLCFLPAQALLSLTSLNGRCRVHGAALAAALAGRQAALRAHKAQPRPASPSSLPPAGKTQAAGLDAYDAAAADELAALQKLMARACPPCIEQFERHIITLPESSHGHARLTVERMELEHWRSFYEMHRSLSQWNAVYSKKPILDAEGDGAPQEEAAFKVALREARRHKAKRQLDEWVLEEKRVRRAVRAAAEKVATRADAFWLVDPAETLRGLPPPDRAEAERWLAAREPALAELRRVAVPSIVEAVLEIFAMHADHLPVQERLAECE